MNTNFHATSSAPDESYNESLKPTLERWERLEKSIEMNDQRYSEILDDFIRAPYVYDSESRAAIELLGKITKSLNEGKIFLSNALSTLSKLKNPKKILASSDISILKNRFFKRLGLINPSEKNTNGSQLLCVEHSKDGQKLHLGTIDRTEITIWNVVKAFFGFGKLANKNYSLIAVSDYISQHDISNIDPNTPEHDTLYGVATRILRKKKDLKKMSPTWQELISSKINKNLTKKNRTLPPTSA